jgi:mono/diheme cytochrome c family protein
LAKKYNCTGCHEIEGKGGDYVNIVAATKDLDLLNAKRFSPPTLQAQGTKVYPDWLFKFLKNPTSIRYGLEVRMPTFGFSDEEATLLVKYFSALEDEPFPYETIALQTPNPEELSVGKQIFDTLQCISCHPEQGEVIPPGSDKTGRPDLALAKHRLKADWIIDWLKDPQTFQPGTAMPQAWPKIGGVHQPVDGFKADDAEEQIRLVRDYLISLGE